MEEGRGLFVEIYDQYENFAFKHDVGSIVFVVFFLQEDFNLNLICFIVGLKWHFHIMRTT